MGSRSGALTFSCQLRFGVKRGDIRKLCKPSSLVADRIPERAPPRARLQTKPAVKQHLKSLLRFRALTAR